jgi:hypothetical protein
MTHEKYWPSVVSQVTTSTAFISRLFSNVKDETGSGVAQNWTAAYKLEDGQWYTGYEILDTTPIDEFKEAQLAWVNFNIPCSISGDEEDKNQGKEAFHNLLAEKMKLVTQRATHYMGKAIMQGTGETAKEPLGLSGGSATTGSVAETPTTREYAGLTCGTDDVGSGDFTNWWRNQTVDGGDDPFSLSKLRSAVSKSKKAGGKPSIIVTRIEGSDAMWESVQGLQRYTKPHPEIAAIGFTSLSFDDIPVVHDFHCYPSTGTSSNFYVLQEDDFILRFIKGKFMHRTPWLVPIDQEAKVMHCRNKLTFGPRTPRLQSVYHSAAD